MRGRPHFKVPPSPLRAGGLFLLLAITASGCSPAKISVAVTDAWCPPPLSGAPAMACYLTLRSQRLDKLTSVSSPAARRVELHTMNMSGEVMRMRRVEDGLALPGGQAVSLAPGADHLMLFAPTVSAGSPVPLTLNFARSLPVTVQATVRFKTQADGLG